MSAARADLKPKEVAMTTTMSGAATVTALYEAFGRGDVPSILALLADDVSWDADWADNSAQNGGVPYLRPRCGKDEVAGFFQLLSGYAFTDFRVLDLLVSDSRVAAVVEVAFTTPGGTGVRDQEVHLWTLGGDGKVTAFRHYLDTAKHLAAAG